MKKFSILILTLIALTGFNACTSDDDVVFIAQPDAEGINFLNSFSSSYVLTSATAENTAERFVWNEIDLDTPTNITYELQGSTSEEFDDFTVLGTTSGNNLPVTVKQLSDLAEDAGLDNDPATDNPNTGMVYFRVVATVGTAGEMAHTSEVQALNVVLPESTGEGESFRNFFLVGDATEAGWDPNNNNTPLFRDADNEDIYYFTGRFAGGAEVEGFKLLETTEWQPQWGLDNGNLTSSDILGEDPSSFPVDADEYYTLEINVDEMTYSFEPYDESGDVTYDSMGIIGDATPNAWDDPDTDMTQSSFDPHIWFINSTELTDGELKFRAQDSWDVNWGADTPLSGKATNDGPNIPVEAGTYDIWFNDITGRYILIPQEVQE